MRNLRPALALAAVAALTLTACSESSDTTPSAASASASTPATESMAKPTSPATPSSATTSSAPAAASSASSAAAGSYITRDDYSADPKAHPGAVLFFHASWCPACKAIKEAFTASPESIPAGVSVVEVDYDSATDLRKKYGVTMQHTFVRVTPDGEASEKWTSTSADDARRRLSAS